MSAHVQVKLKKFQYCAIVQLFNLKGETNILYWLDTCQWDISSLYLLSFWWLWITAYKNLEFGVFI